MDLGTPCQITMAMGRVIGMGGIFAITLAVGLTRNARERAGTDPILCSPSATAVIKAKAWTRG